METRSARGRALTGLPVIVLVVGLIALTIALGYIFYTLYRNSEYDRASVQMAADVRVLVEQLSETAAAASLGDDEARSAMLRLRARMDAIWLDVEQNLADQLPAAQIAAFGLEWKRIQAQVDTIAAQGEEATGFRGAVAPAPGTRPRRRRSTPARPSCCRTAGLGGAAPGPGKPSPGCAKPPASSVKPWSPPRLPR
jgi:hypothetical protein